MRLARGKYFALAKLWDHGAYSTKVKSAIFVATIVPVLLSGMASSPALASSDDDLAEFYHQLRSIAKLHAFPLTSGDAGEVTE